jgi:restriction endonuclease S subunit
MIEILDQIQKNLLYQQKIYGKLAMRFVVIGLIDYLEELESNDLYKFCIKGKCEFQFLMYILHGLNSDKYVAYKSEDENQDDQDEMVD